MVNTAITPITTYATCTLKLPAGVIDNIERIQKQCLLRGNDLTKKGGNLAAWSMVARPKSKGVREYLIFGCKMMLSSSNNCINSIAGKIYLGYNLFGSGIILPKFHMVHVR